MYLLGGRPQRVKKKQQLNHISYVFFFGNLISTKWNIAIILMFFSLVNPSHIWITHSLPACVIYFFCHVMHLTNLDVCFCLLLPWCSSIIPMSRTKSDYPANQFPHQYTPSTKHSVQSVTIKILRYLLNSCAGN